MNGKKLAGIICIVLGIALSAGLIAFQYNHCVDMWSNTHKGQEYASALDYFWEVSNGAIFISIVILVISAVAGASLLRQSE